MYAKTASIFVCMLIHTNTNRHAHLAYSCAYSYTHTNAHTYTNAHSIFTYFCACSYTRLHTYTHTSTHSCILMRVLILAFAYFYAYSYAYLHTECLMLSLRIELCFMTQIRNRIDDVERQLKDLESGYGQRGIGGPGGGGGRGASAAAAAEDAVIADRVANLRVEFQDMLQDLRHRLSEIHSEVDSYESDVSRQRHLILCLLL